MNKKYIKWAVIALVSILIIVLIFLIYQNIFAGNKNSRNKDIDNYKIVNNELNAVEDKIKELEQVKSVDIHKNRNSKIIKIVVVLKEDVSFDTIKTLANQSIANFSEENREYYDFEFYVDSENTESEVYPKIGYKFKSNSEFSW